MRALSRLALVCLLIASGSACRSNNSPAPAPGTPAGESITGRERIGWDQTAANASELATFRYAVYVDGVRSELAEVSCSDVASQAGFPCSGRLPAMSAGAHTLEIAALVDNGGIIEGPRSAPFRVTVTGATAPPAAAPLKPGDRVDTADGIPLLANLVAEGLDEPNDIAIAGDGRIIIAERYGTIAVLPANRPIAPVRMRAADAHGPILSLALAADFDATRHIFTVTAPLGEGAAQTVRLVRYTLRPDHVADAAVLLSDIPATSTPTATVRFGPDGKLYAALGGADDPSAALRPSEWSGKILRLERDGRTPVDQPAASPVFWSGLAVTGGLGWAEDGTLWVAETGGDGVERIRGIVASPETPGRPVQRRSYLLPAPFAPRSLAVAAHDPLSPIAGDIFVAGTDAQYLLRISLDEQDRGRARASERLLDGRTGAVRTVAIGHDGAVYFCTATELWSLVAERR